MSEEDRIRKLWMDVTLETMNNLIKLPRIKRFKLNRILIKFGLVLVAWTDGEKIRGWSIWTLKHWRKHYDMSDIIGK